MGGIKWGQGNGGWSKKQHIRDIQTFQRQIYSKFCFCSIFKLDSAKSHFLH